MGRAKVGRSAVSDYLEQNHGFKSVGLQDGVKRLMRTLHGYHTYHRIPWETYIRYYDALYKLDSNIWIGYFVSRLNRSHDTTNMVVDDVRYLNELEILKNLGFKIVRITAPDIRVQHLQKNLMDAAPGNLLLNEWYNKDFTSQVGVDYSIHNDSREGMRKAVDSLIVTLAVEDEISDE